MSKYDKYGQIVDGQVSDENATSSPSFQNSVSATNGSSGGGGALWIMFVLAVIVGGIALAAANIHTPPNVPQNSSTTAMPPVSTPTANSGEGPSNTEKADNNNNEIESETSSPDTDFIQEKKPSGDTPRSDFHSIPETNRTIPVTDPSQPRQAITGPSKYGSAASDEAVKSAPKFGGDTREMIILKNPVIKFGGAQGPTARLLVSFAVSGEKGHTVCADLQVYWDNGTPLQMQPLHSFRDVVLGYDNSEFTNIPIFTSMQDLNLLPGYIPHMLYVQTVVYDQSCTNPYRHELGRSSFPAQLPTMLAR